MGILTFDIFDKFSCFWTGLEALNPVLQKKIGTCNEAKRIKCDNCGHEWSISSPAISGIRCLLKDKMQNPKLYQRLRSFRVNLMHSTIELGKIAAEAGELTPKLAEILFRGICFALDFEDWNSLPYKETLESVPIRLELQGKLIGNYSGNLGFDGKDPYLEPSHNLVDLKVEEDGSFSFKNASSSLPKLTPSKVFSCTNYECMAKKE